MVVIAASIHNTLSMVGEFIFICWWYRRPVSRACLASRNTTHIWSIPKPILLRISWHSGISLNLQDIQQRLSFQDRFLQICGPLVMSTSLCEKIVSMHSWSYITRIRKAIQQSDRKCSTSHLKISSTSGTFMVTFRFPVFVMNHLVGLLKRN